MSIENLPYPSVLRVMEVTAFKDEKTAVAAIEALKWLDRGAPHQLDGLDGVYYFDIEKFVSFKYDPYGERCGTACCIAGAISILKKNGQLDGGSTGGSDELDMEFGTKWYHEDELSQLFYPSSPGVPGVAPKTPEQAAKALRQYLFTGKTVWE